MSNPTAPPLDELAVLTVTKNRAGHVTGVKELIHIGKPGVSATGEIVLAEDLGIQHLNLAALHQDRSKVWRALRPEVQAFTSFVLLFRNNRRGITPGIQKLCRWYSAFTGKRVDNVRRYVETLRQASILVGDSAVGRLWQKTGAKSKDVLAEECIAGNRHLFQAAKLFSLPPVAHAP